MSGSAESSRRPVPVGKQVRAGIRVLTDRRAWRTAGRTEYAFVTVGFSNSAAGRIALRAVVGSLAILMLPVGLVMLWHPMGPPDQLRLVLHVTALIGSTMLGLWWILDSRPGWRHALYFIVASDLLILLGTATLGAPQARICGTTYLGMIAMLVAFMLGWRVLVLQCTFALLVIGAYVTYAVVAEGQTLLGLYVYVAPAVTMEVGLPMIVQALVEVGRQNVGQVFVERNRDSLTGLFSRQGMRFETRSLLRKRGREVCVVAMLDLDSFKKYNDTYGHSAGDKMLAETANRLREGLDDALIGRIGGDEFIVVAMRSSHYGADAVIRALRRLVSPDDGPAPIQGSIGAVIVLHPTAKAIEIATERADAALYEAKRDRALRIVVGLLDEPDQPESTVGGG